MKSGLNFLDVNTLKQYLAYGGNLDECASKIKCTRAVLDAYIESMDPDEVEKLKSMAPADVDAEALKAEIKAELMEELFGGDVTPAPAPEITPEEAEAAEADFSFGDTDEPQVEEGAEASVDAEQDEEEVA